MTGIYKIESKVYPNRCYGLNERIERDKKFLIKLHNIRILRYGEGVLVRL